MLSGITEDHAHQDIDTAMAIRIDSFALNVDNAIADFIPAALNSLFGYAEYRGFKLYISLDVYASGDACYKGSTSCNGVSSLIFSS
jgi:glucan endo-1,3-alpha-glucosidase